MIFHAIFKSSSLIANLASFTAATAQAWVLSQFSVVLTASLVATLNSGQLGLTSLNN